MRRQQGGAMGSTVNEIRDLSQQEYKWGFVTEIEAEHVPRGLNEDIIRMISARKREPEFMLEWRLKAYRYGASLKKSQAKPKWANVVNGPMNNQKLIITLRP